MFGRESFLDLTLDSKIELSPAFRKLLCFEKMLRGDAGWT